jgi:methylmalonyl-CoA mutase N-terminal domain/subunit
MTSVRDLSATVREQRDEIEQLRKQLAAWRQRYEKGDTRDIGFMNSTHEVAPLYSALDTLSQDPTTVGVPGEFPFTRGIHPTGYRGKLWTMRSSPASARRRRPTRGTSFCSSTGRPGSPSPSTSRR